DLAGPVLGAVLDVIGAHDGPHDMRARLRADLPNARTADQVCHAAADVLGIALTLREHHQVLRAAGYGSERYDESLLLTEVIEEIDDPAVDVSATIASLRGRIG
ncbi:MAG: hypothetical protein KTR31_37970, partial [Myxococcales bacterium]|nr:hypothetical protein [Myxococcales bacterium]